MEKIQSAIAKARAARLERSGDAPPPPVPPAGLSAPTAAPPPPAVSAAAGVAAAWAALPSFTPVSSQLMRQHVVTVDKGKDVAHFDAMRTRLLQQMRANNWRRLAITSPRAGCGKSTVTLNLGFSLARQAEARTLLAELDFHRPALSRILGLKAEHRFSRVLDGSGRFEDNALRYGTNLAFATQHGTERHSAELLASPRVSTVLSEIEARYDPTITLFDLPPMLATDDAMAFIGQVDCVLIIAAAESTTIKEVDLCERELATQTNVLGVVLNKCRYMGPEYGYGYYE